MIYGSVQILISLENVPTVQEVLIQDDLGNYRSDNEN